MLLLAVMLTCLVPSLPIFRGGSLIELLNILVKDTGIYLSLAFHQLKNPSSADSHQTVFWFSKGMQCTYTIAVLLAVRLIGFYKKRQRISKASGFIQFMDSTLTEFFELFEAAKSGA